MKNTYFACLKAFFAAFVVLLLIVASLFALNTQAVFAQNSQDNTEPEEKWAVVDADSRVVGELLGLSGSGDSAFVGLKFFGIEFVIEVSKTEFFGNTGGVFFESNNCTGRALIIHKKTLSPLVAVAPPLNTLYIAVDSEDEPLQVRTGSTFDENGICENLSVSGLEFNVARNVVNLTREFTPPFSLKLVTE